MTQFLEKYTSHFIWKGCVWEGVGDWTELQHIDPHSYSHQCFFPVLLGCSTRGLGSSLSGCWFSLPHLISNSSDPQNSIGGSRGPLLPGAVFSTASFSNSLISKLLNRGPEGSLCWVLAFSTASCLQLIEFLVHSVI